MWILDRVKPLAGRDGLGPWVLTMNPKVAWSWLCFWGLTAVISVAAVVTGIILGRYHSAFWLSFVYMFVGAGLAARYGVNVMWLRRRDTTLAESSD